MATYYIDNATGNDTTGNGSVSLPWLTISKFNTACASGDTLRIFKSASTYAFPSLTSISKTWTITSYNPTTGLTGLNPNDVLIDGAAGTNQWRNSTTISTYAVGVTLKNFSGVAGGLFVANANNWTLVTTNVIFRDLALTSSGYSSGGIWSALTSSGCSWTLNGCLIYNITGNTASGLNPLFCTHQISATLNVYNTYVYLDATGTSQITYIAATNAGTLTTTYKNFILDNAGGAVAYIGGSPTYSNSCSYTSNGAISNIPSGSNNITSDPLPRDRVNRNFKLKPTSPCIGTGILI